MKPYYQHDGITIYHGDCRDVLPKMQGIDLLLSDPPYGVNHDTDYTRFSGGLHGSRDYEGPIAGDDKEFDPRPFLDYPNVVLFGFNCFSHLLPPGSLLVWLKRRDSQLGVFMSDCEVAWVNRGHGVYLTKHVWYGHDRETERGNHWHPTQKPVAVMRWCIERSASSSGAVLDPFMGVGASLVAAKQLGRRAIGVEIEERYCEIAAKRLSQGVLSFETNPSGHTAQKSEAASAQTPTAPEDSPITHYRRQ